VPEGLEAEIWRRAAQPLVGRDIHDAWVDERVAPDGFVDQIVGRRIEAVRRMGKVVLIDTDGATLGVHLGMTGRLEVDGRAPIDRLEYASGADRAEWDRLRMWTDPEPDRTCALRMNDPRRLGRLSLDPDLNMLGPDALTLSAEALRNRLSGRRAAIKSLLLDPGVVAGLGNLCADEVLFWSGVSPRRAADELSTGDLERIAAACRERLPRMLAAGGSTHGILDPTIRAAPRDCPIDGTALERATVGGRTTIWCPRHQE
jgi:formamidopyrimidine-DNA glycosylase